ncbi:hypothetical protein NMG60_11009798 [Bertholletia excelsa]
MGPTTPVEVGTRGTVASLVKKEIEYFHGLELDGRGGSKRPHGQIRDLGSGTTGSSKPGFGFLIMTWTWRRKKRRTGGLLPSMCSVVEVADTHRMELGGIPGFNYRNLKDEAKKFDG